MIGGLPAYEYRPCLFKGGPLDGEHGTIACIGPDSPCDQLCIVKDGKLHRYITGFVNQRTPLLLWEKEGELFVLHYEEENCEAGG